VVAINTEPPGPARAHHRHWTLRRADHLRTSASENIANVGSVAAGATVNVTLAASSVTTFVGPVGPEEIPDHQIGRSKVTAAASVSAPWLI